MHSDIEQFRLPDVGEGLAEATIVRWLVQPGEPIALDQPMVEIETAKATVELPSPHAGVVVEQSAPEGTTVPVGEIIVTIDRAGSPPAATAADPEPDDPEPDDGSFEGWLVGYGPPVETGRPLAKPPVRKRAKDLGVDLALVSGSGPNGAVTREDVERHVARGIERVAVPSIHRHMAAAMVRSAFTAPHATEFVTVDITATLALRERLARRREFLDVRLTPLTFVARALLQALRRTPEANSEWDDGRGEIVIKHFVNLGIAVATDRGLVVPAIADADRLGLAELARAIAQLTEAARAGRSTPAELIGGTITITNIGVFGIDTGTPILNPGQAAILAVGAVNRRPWVVDTPAGELVEPRSVMELALSFDHRILDGQRASRFLVDVAGILSDPGLAMV